MADAVYLMERGELQLVAAGPGPLSLDYLQTAVGGYIEVVAGWVGPRCNLVVIANEEAGPLGWAPSFRVVPGDVTVRGSALVVCARAGSYYPLDAELQALVRLHPGGDFEDDPLPVLELGPPAEEATRHE